MWPVTASPLIPHLESLNPDQRQAVEHPSGPALVLAGAGSGKTRVLTTRAAWLLHQGVAADAVVLVTFTNKAAAEMKHRVLELTGAQLPWSGTFHSLSARLLRRHGMMIGLPNTFSIFDTDDQQALINRIYKEHGFTNQPLHPKAALHQISDQKNQMITASETAERASDHYWEQVARVYKLYQYALSQNAAVDFDDLLLKAIELLQQPSILEQYQSQFSHVLIDEYQDTNKAQYLLTQLLSAPQNNLYVVGDFSQSIYAWRGADYTNMLALKTDFTNIAEYRLEQNYRSTPIILEAANQVVSHNTSHPILSLWTQRTVSESAPLIIHETQSAQHEAETVLNYIVQRRQQGASLNDFAILYRTNAQSRAFEETFIRYGLPYQVVGGTKFYERKEVKDVLSYLKVLANPQDTVSLARAEKIGKRRLDSLQRWQQQKYSNSDSLIVADPGALVEEILNVTRYLDKYDPKDPDELSRIENVKELVAVAQQFATVLQFLENVALVQNDYLLEQTATDSAQQITLMSLHAAKGLEFSTVFLVGMEEGLLPHSRSLTDRQQMEEERRLCYVGITRAKDQVICTYTRQRWTYQGPQLATRSRFLGDIDPDLTQLKGHTAPAESYPASGRRVVPLDDAVLEGVLNGELDAEAFLDL